MLRRGRALVACVGVLALVATACGTDDSGDDGAAPTETGDGTTVGAAEPVTLEIAANAIRGGKNDSEAVWIEDYVTPRSRR